MNEQKVYLFFCDNFPSDVFDSKEKAFNYLPQYEFSEITQSVSTCDGIEEITPTVDNFYLNVPIHVHVKAHTEERAREISQEPFDSAWLFPWLRNVE